MRGGVALREFVLSIRKGASCRALFLAVEALYRLLDLPTRVALWYNSSPRALSPTTTDRGRVPRAGLLAIFSFSTR